AAIHAALAGTDGALAGPAHPVTFGGDSELVLRPGARVVSDPVALALAPLAQVAVSFHVPEQTAAGTVDALGLMPAWIAPGDQAARPDLSDAQQVGSFFWLRGMSVATADPGAGTIVTLGDSITEGY